VIAAGETEGEVRVATNENGLDEDDRGFVFTISAAVNATIADGEGRRVVGIADNDPPPVLRVTAPSPVGEGDEVAFTISLSAPSAKNISVGYATSDDTARAGADYVARDGRLVIAAGATEGVVRVATNDNGLDEVDRRFVFAISQAVNATIAGGSQVVVIADDDPPPVLRVTAPSQVDEGEEVAFTISLSAPSAKNISVMYATADGVARAGTDYVARDGRLVIAAGATESVVTVATLLDGVHEGDEGFAVRIGQAANATIASDGGEASVRIGDVDSQPVLRVTAPAQISEGEEAVFTIASTTPSSTAISVMYATVDGTAMAGEDYVAISGKLVIPAGATEGEVRVAVLADGVYEGGEGFAVRISGAVNATIASDGGEATVTIGDIDSPPILRITAPAQINEGQAVTFTITKEGASKHPVQFDYTTAQASTAPNLPADQAQLADAVAGVDYSTTQGTAVIPSGDSSLVVVVPTSNNTLDEVDRGFAFVISNLVNATLADNGNEAWQVVVIADDDPQPQLRVTAQSPVDEGEEAVFTISLSQPSAKNISFMYATTDGTATAGEDYMAKGGTLVIPAGETEGEVAVVVLADGVYEGEEGFALRMSQAANATIASDDGEARVSIRSLDPLPSISVTAASPEVDAGSEAVFTISITGMAEGNIKVDYFTAGGNATADGDYIATRGTLDFGGGESRTIRVATVLEDYAEGDEDFYLRLTNPVNASLTTNQTRIVIRGQKGTPFITAQNAVGVEGEILSFPVALSHASPYGVSVAYTMQSGTANTSDFSSANGSLVFQPGQTDKTIDVSLLADIMDEDNETFNLTLLSPQNATLITTSMVGEIIDNNLPPVMGITGESVVEGETAHFTLIASRSLSPHNLTIGVQIMYVAGDGDEEVVLQYVTLPAGEREMQFEFATEDNEEVAGNAPITVSLLNGTGYILNNPASISVAVHDNDEGDDRLDAINRLVLPQLGNHIARQISESIAGRIIGALRYGHRADNRTRQHARHAKHGELTIQGQTLAGFATAQAQKEADETPWGITNSANGLPRAHDLAFALPIKLAVNGEAQTQSLPHKSPYRPMGLTLWGEGMYGEVSHEDYEGEIPIGIIATDAWLNAKTLVGIGISETNAEFTSANGIANGSYRHQSDLSLIHPYLGTMTAGGSYLWGMAGFGDGDLKITGATDNASAITAMSGLSMRMLALGFESPLQATHEDHTNSEYDWGVTGEIAYAEIKNGASHNHTRGYSISQAEFASGYARFGFVLNHDRPTRHGRINERAEATLRYDGGDGDNGFGIEISGRVTADLNRGLGLEFAARTRTLLWDGDTRDDWGVRGSLSWTQHAHPRDSEATNQAHGFAIALTPEWGNGQTQHATLWDGGLGDLTTMHSLDADLDTSARTRLDIRYGIGLKTSNRKHKNIGMLIPFITHEADGAVKLGADLVLGRHGNKGFVANAQTILPHSDRINQAHSMFTIHYRQEF
ncbi:MAG: hypothetical protein MJE68_30095, partial [Proteobacteria bacterium]|nr:hypothetical protein [Pseudomonadota bacterium]